MDATPGRASNDELADAGAVDYARAEQISRRIAAARLGGVAREGIEVEDVVQDVLARLVATDQAALLNAGSRGWSG